MSPTLRNFIFGFFVGCLTTALVMAIVMSAIPSPNVLWSDGQLALAGEVDNKRGAALVYPVRSDYPRVFLKDYDSDGRFDSVTVMDPTLFSMSAEDEDGDGRFDSLSVTTSEADKGITFKDTNIDGQFDQRIGPSDAYAVMVRSKWHTVSRIDGVPHISLDGKLTKLVNENGSWVLPESE